MNTEKKYPRWIVSRRAKKWAGPMTFLALEFLGIVISMITIAVRSNMQPSYDDTPLWQIFAWCLGTPIVIIAVVHLLFGLDAASQSKMDGLKKRKCERE